MHLQGDDPTCGACIPGFRVSKGVVAAAQGLNSHVVPEFLGVRPLLALNPRNMRHMQHYPAWSSITLDDSNPKDWTPYVASPFWTT